MANELKGVAVSNLIKKMLWRIYCIVSFPFWAFLLVSWIIGRLLFR